MRAIARAEEFIGRHAEESRAIVASFIAVDPALLAELWDAYEFRASLDHWLLLSMEDQARWAMDSGLVDTAKMPNYLDSIHFNSLESVDPSAVTIIH